MDLIWLGLATTSATAFAAGGLTLRATQGFTRPLMSAVALGLFAVGVILNARLIRRGGEVGPAYLAIVGLETLVVVLAGAVLFAEQVTGRRVVALLLVLSGVLLLSDR